MKNNKGTIDIFKFLMALIVIEIHTQPFVNISNSFFNNLLLLIEAIAVPYFFMASGYFLMDKCKKTSKKNWPNILIDFIKKMTKLYVIWTIIYLPLTLIYYINNVEPWYRDIVSFIRGFLFIGEQYNSWHLWYLLSAIYGSIVIYWGLLKKVNIKKIAIIGGIGLIMGFTTDIFITMDFVGLNAKIKSLIQFIIPNGRIFEGLFYITMGMIFYKNNISFKTSITSIIISAICFFIFPSSFFKDIMITVFSLSLFNIALYIKVNESAKYKILRKTSTIMYFIHMYVWSIYYTIIYGEKTYSYDSFFATSIISILISLMYIKIKNNLKIKTS